MLGRVKRVENIARKFGADPWYYYLKVQDEAGTEEYWLLTEEEVARIRERVAKNPEDLAANKESWLADLLD